MYIKKNALVISGSILYDLSCFKGVRYYLESQIFLFCWQVILLTLGKIRSIFVLFFLFLKDVFLLCRTKAQHYGLLSMFFVPIIM